MPFKCRKEQSAYQRRWENGRRLKWLDANGPCRMCGSTENLTVDHVNPMDKATHRVWSWAHDRMMAELSKCQVLCRSCHVLKTNQNSDKAIGHKRVQLYGRSLR